jgi:hypothetical protein
MQRTMNRVTLPLLMLACSALGAWAVSKHIQCSRLEDRLAKMESEAARAVRGLEPSKSGGGGAILKGTAGSQEAPGGSGETGTGRAPDLQSTRDATREMAAGFAKMMANPKMRDMLKSQFRTGIDLVYRDLHDLLDLKEPQRSKLEKLINEKASVDLETGLALMDGNRTAEDLKAATAEIKSKIAGLDGQIKALLEKEDYEKLTRYEDSSMERMQLKKFDTLLRAKDMRLDESTEAKLMDVMYREKGNFPFAGRFVDYRNPDISRFTAENTARFSDEYARLNESVAKQAAGLLTAEQLGIFRQSQEQQLNQINMQLGVAVRMFSGGGDK